MFPARPGNMVNPVPFITPRRGDPKPVLRTPLAAITSEVFHFRVETLEGPPPPPPPAPPPASTLYLRSTSGGALAPPRSHEYANTIYAPPPPTPPTPIYPFSTLTGDGQTRTQGAPGGPQLRPGAAPPRGPGGQGPSWATEAPPAGKRGARARGAPHVPHAPCDEPRTRRAPPLVARTPRGPANGSISTLRGQDLSSTPNKKGRRRKAPAPGRGKSRGGGGGPKYS
ncbi:proline-rich protein 2-like [Penaeus monodon]|uniref:proline-rich protein 2-like n=1 Tax=Penaeus monodon TaxID=6687 RepID=UPI0018A78295|nr:proline-rich protein 2-like [Penaeus monodon]